MLLPALSIDNHSLPASSNIPSIMPIYFLPISEYCLQINAVATPCLLTVIAYLPVQTCALFLPVHRLVCVKQEHISDVAATL